MQQYLEENQELFNLLGGCQPLQVQQLMDGVINVVWKGGCEALCAGLLLCEMTFTQDAAICWPPTRSTDTRTALPLT